MTNSFKLINTNAEYRNAVNAAKMYDHAYFVENNPLISDAEYDSLYFHIQAYEVKHPGEILPDSPTQHVGSDLKDGKHTVMHRTPMMSTQKCKTVEDLRKWMVSTTKALRKMGKIGKEEEPKFSIEWKYDGCSCSLVYQDGILIEASTRGDYLRGQDILCHVKNMPSIPKTLYYGERSLNGDEFIPSEVKTEGRIEVRGEILMPFAKLEDTHGAYKDARTAAASILNTDSPTPYDHLLEFQAWQLITDTAHCPEADETNAEGQRRGLAYIGPDEYQSSAICNLYSLLGFETGGVCTGNADDIAESIADFTEDRSSLSYPTDGLVIKLDDKRLWDCMGKTEHHPKFCIAYKFPPQTAITTCTRIEITVGETGKRTPIATFTPVTMNGKTYTKASLGSEATAEKMGIKVGSRIEFALSNDVIPHINRVIE